MNTFEVTKSKLIKFDSSADIVSETKKFEYVLAIYTDCVMVQKACDFNRLTGLTELRAFSESGELHLINVNGTFKGRYRYDNVNDGIDTEYYAEKQLIWGSATDKQDKTTRFHEDRGIDIELPVIAEKGDKAFLEIRNYLSDDEFTFVDYRICGINTGKAGEV